jgi:hypothetical protein
MTSLAVVKAPKPEPIGVCWVNRRNLLLLMRKGVSYFREACRKGNLIEQQYLTFVLIAPEPFGGTIGRWEVQFCLENDETLRFPLICSSVATNAETTKYG